jgi:hypothetical protein
LFDTNEKNPQQKEEEEAQRTQWALTTQNTKGQQIGRAHDCENLGFWPPAP